MATERSTRLDMREHVREQAELAISYAEDGAYASAARVLRELARVTQAHAEAVTDDMQRMLATAPKGR